MTTRVTPWLAVVLFTSVLVIPVLAAARPVLDPDVWWHLRAGRWIVEHGRVTDTDPFCTCGEGRPWVAYSWLFEVLLHALYTVFGLMGLVVLRVVLALAVAAAFLRLASRSGASILESTSLAAIAAFAVVPLMAERPWLFTILFTTLTLQVILDLREGNRRRTFWALPLVFVLWANLHIQFVYGLALLGMACTATFIDRKSTRNESFRSLVLLTTLCALATLLNPYHYRLYGVVLEYATQQVPFQVVAELSAPDFRVGWDWLILALTVSTFFTLGRRRDQSLFELLLLLLSTILWLRARRDLWLVVLSTLTILPPRERSGSGREPTAFAMTIAVILAFGAAFLIVRGRDLSNERLREAEQRLFPMKACEAVEILGYRGPVFNEFDWGGYLIWKLPECKVSIDGRTNLYGDERMRRSFDTWRGYKGWEEDEELRRAGLIFAPARSPLASLLRLDRERYRKVYEDEQAALFVPISNKP